MYYDKHFRKIYPFKLDYRDTLLFNTFLEIFPIKLLKNIEFKNVNEIHKIKKSDVFHIYLNNYKQIINKIDNLFEINILDPYNAFREETINNYDREKSSLRESLIQDTEASVILYKMIRYNFNKIKGIKKWLKNKYFDNLPTLEIMSYLDYKRDDLIYEYLYELFEVSKTNYKN